MNQIQIDDDMSNLINAPQNHMTNKGKVSNMNRIQTVGMLKYYEREDNGNS